MYAVDVSYIVRDVHCMTEKKRSVTMRLDGELLDGIVGERTATVEAALRAYLGRCPTCGAVVGPVRRKLVDLRAGELVEVGEVRGVDVEAVAVVGEGKAKVPRAVDKERVDAVERAGKLNRERVYDGVLGGSAVRDCSTSAGCLGSGPHTKMCENLNPSRRKK
jgi:hypothetical protein